MVFSGPSADERSVHVPVAVTSWMWPLKVAGIDCGSCGEPLPIERATELSEIVAAVSQHARVCTLPE